MIGWRAQLHATRFRLNRHDMAARIALRLMAPGA